MQQSGCKAHKLSRNGTTPFLPRCRYVAKSYVVKGYVAKGYASAWPQVRPKRILRNECLVPAVNHEHGISVLRHWRAENQHRTLASKRTPIMDGGDSLQPDYQRFCSQSWVWSRGRCLIRVISKAFKSTMFLFMWHECWKVSIDVSGRLSWRLSNHDVLLHVTRVLKGVDKSWSTKLKADRMVIGLVL